MPKVTQQVRDQQVLTSQLLAHFPALGLGHESSAKLGYLVLAARRLYFLASRWLFPPIPARASCFSLQEVFTTPWMPTLLGMEPSTTLSDGLWGGQGKGIFLECSFLSF